MTTVLFNKIFGDLIPNGMNTNEKNILINCPFPNHADTNASFSISTDENKPVYSCFGCSEKGSWIGFYMKRNNLTYPEALKALDMDKPIEQRPMKQPIVKVEPPRVDTDYSDYCMTAASNVFDNYEFFCQKLFNMRGFTMPTTICCFIGYDYTKGWIFPVIRYSDKKIIGYEVREKYFQLFKFPDGKETKCYKAKNKPSQTIAVFFVHAPNTSHRHEGVFFAL